MKQQALDELRAAVIDKAVIDEEFRARLMEDPKAAIKDAFGLSLPKGFAITIHEDGAMTTHLVLPPEKE